MELMALYSLLADTKKRRRLAAAGRLPAFLTSKSPSTVAWRSAPDPSASSLIHFQVPVKSGPTGGADGCAAAGWPWTASFPGEVVAIAGADSAILAVWIEWLFAGLASYS